jgi:hypothetical protein
VDSATIAMTKKQKQLAKFKTKIAREKFKENLDWLTKLLYQHDPIFLVPMGMPCDEYEAEALMIWQAFENTPPVSEDEIRHVVYEIFLKMFGEGTAGEFSHISYNAIADGIAAKSQELWPHE